MTRIPIPEGSSTREGFFDLDHIGHLMAARPFIPHRTLGNGHTQTILGNLRPRRFLPELAHAERREFSTEPEVRVVGYCSWQASRKQRPTLIIVHGLEGSADASYVLGTAGKAFQRGFNVIRYNVRNCGGTEHLTPTLYHSGLTIDLHLVIRELVEADKLPEIFVAGFSMGGNQALKMAGELGSRYPRQLRAICAVSPPIDLALCSRTIGRPRNKIYEYRFLRSLRRRMLRKAELFPQKYPVKGLIQGLDHVRSLWGFDEVMAPAYGFESAAEYYAKASARPLIEQIEVPTLIIHAQNDPFIPMTGFEDEAITKNPSILFLNPTDGGH
ncbi:MAG: alpha/beta fold hydrolase, partial [Acidobacteriota bacterium]